MGNPYNIIPIQYYIYYCYIVVNVIIDFQVSINKIFLSKEYNIIKSMCLKGIIQFHKLLLNITLILVLTKYEINLLCKKHL